MHVLPQSATRIHVNRVQGHRQHLICPSAGRFRLLPLGILHANLAAAIPSNANGLSHRIGDLATAFRESLQQATFDWLQGNVRVTSFTHCRVESLYLVPALFCRYFRQVRGSQGVCASLLSW